MTALALNDELYPQLLKEIYDPPPVLYLQGDVAALNRQPAIAVVGSRRCSTYGRNATEMLASELATRGVTIISGLARGIDTAAHKAALTAKGKTVAVLGNGLDQVYPRENKDLAAEITNNGAVISELPLGAPPLPQNFPFRNRIISGLCLGVLIVEAAERSGSLITARMALEQGRDVFAVPGNITSGNSFGPNYLIKDGAKLVQSWRDIVEELPTHWKATLLVENSASLQPELPLFSAAEEQIYHLLDLDEPRHIDQLSGKSGLAIGEVLSTLLSLEIKDWVKQLPGKNFVRKI
jgi:DNA processing protein